MNIVHSSDFRKIRIGKHEYECISSQMLQSIGIALDDKLLDVFNTDKKYADIFVVILMHGSCMGSCFKPIEFKCEAGDMVAYLRIIDYWIGHHVADSETFMNLCESVREKVQWYCDLVLGLSSRDRISDAHRLLFCSGDSALYDEIKNINSPLYMIQLKNMLADKLIAEISAHVTAVPGFELLKSSNHDVHPLDIIFTSAERYTFEYQHGLDLMSGGIDAIKNIISYK